MKKILFFGSIFACLTVGQESFSQETYELEQIVISGGNAPISSSDLATSHTIITREEIERGANKTITSILRSVPGLNVSSAGGSTTQIRMRGGEGNHTLVLIDGVEATGGDGEYFFSSLSASHVERIEIMRGPQTVFFGPSASSGVINIITRSAEEKPVTTVEVGIGDTETLGFSKSFSLGNIKNFLSGSVEKNKGYDYSYGAGDKDGSERNTFNWKMSHNTDANAKILLNLRTAHEKYDYDDVVQWPASATSHLDYVIDSNDTGTRDEAQASVTFEKSFNENFSSHQIGLRQTKYESSTVADGKTTDNIKTGVRYLFKKALDDYKIDQTSTLGSIILEKTYDKNNLTPTQKREAFAVGGELRHKFEDATSIQAGYRSESSDKYETAQTWKLALLKPLSDNTNFVFDSGTGVVNPTYCEIYGGTACFGSQGNPNIKPEKNVSYSIGLQRNFLDQKGQTKLIVFKETLTGEITAGPWPTYFPTNSNGKSRRHGTEFDLSVKLREKLELHSNYTYVISRDANKNIESRRPRHEFFMRVRRSFQTEKQYVEINIKNVADNYDAYPTNWSQRKMPDYTVTGLNIGWQLGGIAIYSGISNLFDVNNSDVWGYRNPGRAVYLTAKKVW